MGRVGATGEGNDRELGAVKALPGSDHRHSLLGMIRPVIGQPAPVHPTYATDEVARRFWRLSYRCGRGYLSGRDALDGPVLVNHEREELAGYKRRLRITKARGFVGPILRRYLGLVFRRPPIRPADLPPLATEFVADATGTGVPLDTVMRRALARAQVDRESYLVPDMTGSPGVHNPTQAQLAQAGTRPVVYVLNASCVLHWEEAPGGGLSEILFMWTDANGQAILRWMDKTDFQDFTVKPGATAGGEIVSAGQQQPHGYTTMPVIRLRPVWDPDNDWAGEASAGDSQAGPLAESQQAIANYLSLLNEEIFNVTFSQMIASGVDESAVKDVKVGNCRILCLPNPAARVDFIGANPAQAASIREALTDEISYLYRAAGLAPGDPLASGQAVSGVALAWRASDMASIVDALASATEDAENALWRVLSDAWGFHLPAPTHYTADADLPDFQAEAQSMQAIIASTAIPSVIRRKVAERFAARNLSLSPDEEKELAGSMTEDRAAARAASAAASMFRMAASGMDDGNDEGAG